MSITVTTQISGHVAEIRFAKPPLNFACPELLRKIADELDVIDQNADIRCSVLASDGKSFCAGADLAGDESVTGGDGMNAIGELYVQAERLFRRKKPMIAAIQGAAIGAGIGLALSADFRIAATTKICKCRFGHKEQGLCILLRADLKAECGFRGGIVVHGGVFDAQCTPAKATADAKPCLSNQGDVQHTVSAVSQISGAGILRKQEVLRCIDAGVDLLLPSLPMPLPQAAVSKTADPAGPRKMRRENWSILAPRCQPFGYCNVACGPCGWGSFGPVRYI